MIKKKFSSGAVVFRKEDEKLLFLLIYSQRNKIWGFPKGHIEIDEDEKQAALREIKEETGLSNLSIRNDFREEVVYEVTVGKSAGKEQIVEKHASYFLAQTKEENIKVDNYEITDYRWLESAGALKLLSLESLKQILKRAEGFLKKSK